MNTNNLKPEKVTKPIQLLAAWLLGLVLINTLFLTIATQLNNPDWGANALVLASIANVPIFLFSLFILQTRFRPEMQEDTFYSKYLERKYTEERIIQRPNIEFNTDILVKEILEKIGKTTKPIEKEREIKQILQNREIEIIKNEVKSSRALSELYIYNEKWSEIVESWGDDIAFKNDISLLFKFNLISGELSDPKTLELTELGKIIANDFKEQGLLWNQVNSRRNLKGIKKN